MVVQMRNSEESSISLVELQREERFSLDINVFWALFIRISSHALNLLNNKSEWKQLKFMERFTGP